MRGRWDVEVPELAGFVEAEPQLGVAGALCGFGGDGGLDPVPFVAVAYLHGVRSALRWWAGVDREGAAEGCGAWMAVAGLCYLLGGGCEAVDPRLELVGVVAAVEVACYVDVVGHLEVQ